MSSPNTTTTSPTIPPSPVSSRARAVSLTDSDGDHDHITRIPTSTSHRTADYGHPLERAITNASRRAPPDLAFPYLTTDTSRGGITQEYRVETRAGFIPADDVDHGLQPMRSRATTIQGDRFVLHDKEKGGMCEKKLVTFLEGDPQNPRNWSKSRRWIITSIVSCAVIQVALSSAIVTGDFPDQEEYFGVSSEVIALTVSLTVCGFGTGPLLWSPLSELLGRRWLWAIPTAIYIIFNIPCALAPNIGCLLASRFLCGFFGSAPLTLAGGTIADVWGPDERGFAIAIFAAAPYTGPVIGPLIGGFIGKYAGWRWIYWVNMISAGVVWLASLIIPETFAPVILKKRAKQMRYDSQDDSYVTEQEIFRKPLNEIVIETLIRPFEMLATEPILLCMSLYISLVYGLLYAFFFSFPVVFNEDYGWDDAKTGLTFIPVFIGVGIALFVTPWLERKYVVKGDKAEPEDRLPGMLIGGPFVPISLFIFGWTSPPYVAPGGGSWVGPVSAGIPFGLGMVLVYFSANAYLIEAFPDYVASALAAKTVVRSAAGAAMPLFIPQMFHGLGNGGAASLLAGVAIIMACIPFAFAKWGKKIRARSKRAAL
ncbi:membrane transporter [Cryptococcus neoformans C23]|uniref:Membrane transporter n=1 Tax=Cryptococcus neoformans (strain H99 / ATCC 208821 / CBS 10515 / FGSC 9487) TaxID=235443 RepID=J9VH18_CRYN9|nr:membrane transporter [Cryptococcus neoformans var. grubii H99]AUB22127.1 membrane transporter [Cryptococcus neoformans var. grubii]OWZ48126.1 membrane transporter [Cryptococcus neoformans var. grubii C23]OWZ57897.1 membrane transporter [Cryptococcus neoformans var. grubii 125.91]OXG40822.1 membrane transporter [Cryptococcus neoformans var. grubii Bt15]OXG45486.1 membrane transporter [Cryptococcus neoformans var. grubii Bt120]OXG88853.1 membrane transporter [Cryptococcus neoformans var. gru|eukprot:XP_012046790.1 membrane transporter [Cryptococcus neoformans var. grubii H99]